jgi:hypothetical protein
VVINVPWEQVLFILQRRTTSKDQTMNAKKNSIDAPEKVRVRRRDIKNAETEIGLKLRALYASVQEEEIPARFLDLLEKLDEAERNHTQSSK